MVGASGGTSRYNADAIIRAEDALRMNKPDDALKILDSANTRDHVHGRRIYLQAAQLLNRHRLIIDLIGVPTSIDEFVTLFAAMLGDNSLPEAQKLLDRGAAFGVDAGTLGELRNKLEFKNRFRGSR